MVNISELTWDKAGERFYETGVRHGVLYPFVSGHYQKGVAWNGLTAVNEAMSGAEASPMYADDIKYLNLMSAEEYGATIEAYTYPAEFKMCVGEVELADGVTISQQNHSHFGFSYQTTEGNDTEGTDYGYKIHLVFNCLAASTDKSYATINDSPEAITFSWEITAETVDLEGYKPTAHMILDFAKFRAAGLTNVFRYLENVLYGSEDTDPQMPSINEVLEMVEKQACLLDSSDNVILDSNGNPLLSRVFN